MSFKIQDGYPIPTGKVSRKYPFSDMAVGQSFFVAGEAAARQLTTAHVGYGARNGKKFKVRKVTEEGVVGARLWRVA